MGCGFRAKMIRTRRKIDKNMETGMDTSSIEWFLAMIMQRPYELE